MRIYFEEHVESQLSGARVQMVDCKIAINDSSARRNRHSSAQGDTLEKHARNDPRCLDDVVLDEIVQRGVPRGRALQTKAHQELVQCNINSMVVLGSGSVDVHE